MYYGLEEIRNFQVPRSEIQRKNVNIQPCNRAESSCRANPGNKVTLNKKFSKFPMLMRLAGLN